MNDMAPCPFCGRTNLITSHGTQVLCGDCGAMGPHPRRGAPTNKTMAEGKRDAWNMRDGSLPRSTSSPPAPVATDGPCDKCGREALTVPVTHANGHPLPPGCRIAIGQKQLDELLASLPPAPVDPVEAPRRLRDDQAVRWLVHAWYDNGGTVGGLDELLDAIEAHLAHHTATSEPRCGTCGGDKCLCDPTGPHIGCKGPCPTCGGTGRSTGVTP